MHVSGFEKRTRGDANNKRGNLVIGLGTLGAQLGHSWGTLGAQNCISWGTLGAHLGHSWGTVGAKSYLGHTWGTLGAHLGQKQLGHTWGTLGAQLRQKSDLKHNFCKLNTLGAHLGHT